MTWTHEHRPAHYDDEGHEIQPGPSFTMSDLDTLEAQARVEREHFRDVVLPARIAAVEAEINATLPDGLTVKFWP